MNKKVLSIISFAFLGGALLSTPSSAAISNGVSCPKANATAKVGSKVYKCAKNPYVKPTSRTWTLSGCLTAYSLWKDAKQQYEDFKDLAKIAGPDGEKTLADLGKSIADLETTMQTQACKKGA